MLKNVVLKTCIDGLIVVSAVACLTVAYLNRLDQHNSKILGYKLGDPMYINVCTRRYISEHHIPCCLVECYTIVVECVSAVSVRSCHSVSGILGCYTTALPQKHQSCRAFFCKNACYRKFIKPSAVEPRSQILRGVKTLL